MGGGECGEFSSYMDCLLLLFIFSCKNIFGRNRLDDFFFAGKSLEGQCMNISGLLAVNDFFFV